MIYAIISLLILAVDFIVKYSINSAYKAGGIEIGVPFFKIGELFNLSYVQNEGAAWSMMNGKTFLLGIVSLLVCVVIVVYWIKEKPRKKLLCISLMLIFSGGLGNAIDRLFYGYVVDFIETAFMDFPVFNIADISITFGTILFIINILFFDKDKKKQSLIQD